MGPTVTIAVTLARLLLSRITEASEMSHSLCFVFVIGHTTSSRGLALNRKNLTAQQGDPIGFHKCRKKEMTV